jgi:Rnl2 family RNA ligase
MFRKYNSIENSFQKDFIDKIIDEDYHKQDFVVQEKAHGANLSFWTTDGIQFQTGKRTGILDKDENFYNFQDVRAKNLQKLQDIWKDLSDLIEGLSQLTIFGELIGGDYKHPDVAKVKNSKKTQKGIYYCPSNEFYAFDILINNEYYLNVDQSNALFAKHKLAYAKTLFRGNLEDCLKYPNDKDSVIYKQFGLPQIESNVMEGVVIKPVEPCFLKNGSRVIIKNKNEKWEEKAKRPKRVRKEKEISASVALLQERILEYVTDNRMSNVISKIGPPTMKDMGKILGIFANDVLEDFMKEHGNEMEKLDKNEQKMVTKVINKPAVDLVKDRIKRGG